MIITPQRAACQHAWLGSPGRRLSESELREACAQFSTPVPFRASDPYAPIDPRVQVPFCEPSFVRGRSDK